MSIFALIFTPLNFAVWSLIFLGISSSVVIASTFASPSISRFTFLSPLSNSVSLIPSRADINLGINSSIILGSCSSEPLPVSVETILVNSVISVSIVAVVTFTFIPLTDK